MQLDYAPHITVIILARNNEEDIANCLETVRWANQLVVVDDHSTDRTVEIAERFKAEIVQAEDDNFSKKRNQGFHQARGDWVFYVDTDERVTPELYQEIRHVVEAGKFATFKVRRHDIHYGKWMEHGGWENDWVERLFKREQFEGWTGVIHESPHYQGDLGMLEQPLIHLTHRSIAGGLRKSAEWTIKEAELLLEAKHPPVTILTLLRKSIMEFFRRAFMKGGNKDGMAGWIEAMTQAMNRFIVYAQLWELQQEPQIPEKYAHIDQKMMREWEKFHREGKGSRI